MSANYSDSNIEKIAIIGLSGRFPGAANVEELWQNLKGGVESIKQLSDAELLEAGVAPELLKDPNFVKASATIDDHDKFDATFFGYTPSEASTMDPQHRLFLECGWHAFEDAALDPIECNRNVSVFVGAGLNSYLMRNLMSNKNLLQRFGYQQIGLGNKSDFIPTRLSYNLNLQGPSVNVNTACSSSLVAVQMAVQSLHAYECDLALAGGVSVNVPGNEGYMFRTGGVYSSDGHCRAFDSKADGTVGGSGVGAVLLKRLSDAVADGDDIKAVIAGAAVNNDGSRKIGYTVPSVDGQIHAVREAMEIADVEPESITYVEAHGTGTALGDPIELSALHGAFGISDKQNSCAIGSVKTNLGHLDTAAGVTGLIKVVKCVSEGTLVPTLHYSQPNEAIDFSSGPFYVNTETKPWETDGLPRRASVSAFGIGGTNAHVIVEQAPIRPIDEISCPDSLFILSAKSPAALDQVGDDIAKYLEANSDCTPKDVSRTLGTGRAQFEYRKAFVARTQTDLIDQLCNLQSTTPSKVGESERALGVAFTFPGIGDHYLGMGRLLYEKHRVFAEFVDSCSEQLKPILGIDIRDTLLADVLEDSDSGQQSGSLFGQTNRPKPIPSALDETRFLHPILFSFEYSLAQQLMHWGVKPEALLGYSLGEYVAACISGVFSLPDALEIVSERARLIDASTGGAMLAIMLSEEQVHEFLPENISVGAVNSNSFTVVSGPDDAVSDLVGKLTEKSIACMRLHSSHAFHSWMMDDMSSEFREVLAKFTLNAPEIPFVSNVTGTWITDEQALDSDYWVEHTRSTVRYADALDTLCADTRRVLLEVGPGQSLSGIALQRATASGEEGVIALPTEPRFVSDGGDALFDLVGKMWCAGVSIDRSTFFSEGQRISLPGYSFNREKHWIEENLEPAQLDSIRTSQQVELEPCVYEPYWMQATTTSNHSVPSSRALLIRSKNQKHTSLDSDIAKSFISLDCVSNADLNHPISSHDLTVSYENEEALKALVSKVVDKGTEPLNVIYECFVDEQDITDFDSRCLPDFIRWLRALSMLGVNSFTVVTNQTQSITGVEKLSRSLVGLEAFMRTTRLEFPAVGLRLLDIELLDGSIATETALITKRIVRNDDEFVVAFRGRQDWVRRFRVASDSAAAACASSNRYLTLNSLSNESVRQLEQILNAYTNECVVKTGPDYSEACEVDDEAENMDGWNEAMLQQVLEKASGTNSPIDYVIHGASITASWQTIESVDVDEMCTALVEHEFQLDLLLRLCQTGQLKQVVLLSSLDAMLGEVGKATASMLGELNKRRALLYPEYFRSIHLDIWADTDEKNRLADLPSGLSSYLEQNVFRHGLTSTGTLELVFDIISSARAVALISARDVAALDMNVDERNLDTYRRVASDRPQNNIDSSIEQIQPRNETEILIASFWGELFGHKNIGVNVDFFALGGTSLVGIQLISRLRDTFDVSLPLSVIFDCTTIEKQAIAVEEAIIQELEQEGAEDSDTEDNAVISQFDETERVGNLSPTIYQLPNGLSVKQYNSRETDHFYHDIFVNKVYHKNGIRLDSDAIIFDVGSNVGMFSLYVCTTVETATIYAFEPALPIFECLTSNTAKYGNRVKRFNVGLSNRDSTEQFAFYPQTTGMSTFYPNMEEESIALEAIVSNEMAVDEHADKKVHEHVRELVADRLHGIELSCSLTTASAMIESEAVERIDLLKIDVQKAELEVLEGINTLHWPIVSQVVIEVHDIDDRIAKVTQLLEGHGFTVHVEQDSLYVGSNISNLYALRP